MSDASRDPGQRAPVNGAALLLDGHAPDHPALVGGGQQLGYGALREQVARAAAVWRARGLSAGDRVAVMLPDGFDWVFAWLGAVWAGGVAIGVSPRLEPTEWQRLRDEARFAFVLAETDQDAPDAWRARTMGRAEWQRAMAAAAPIAPEAVASEAPAFWVYSSGTSGRPKGVVHAHRSLREIGRISEQRLGLTRASRVFSSSRLFFTYPLVNVLLAGLRIGATILLDARWPTAHSVAGSVEALRPTVLFSVPTLYRGMLRESLAERVRDAGVQCCVSAGEALPAGLRDEWQRRTGLPMIDGYGTSETLVLVLTSVAGDDGLMPSPGVQIDPVDAATAAAGAPVRLSVRVGTLALGYHERPESQASHLRDGAFFPADLFVRTDGGGWRFAGREDSLLKISGRWVDLIDLEERIAAGLPGLREAAVVGVADADGVESLALFYATDDERAVRELLAERIATLPHHQRPARLVPVEELPRTATGKLLRRRLAERIAAASD